jgi:FAD/FMN-containing dehydrogenase
LSAVTAITADLRRTVRGSVLLPSDDEFERARRPWNLAVDQPVLAVVEAADADDAASLVRYAGAAGLAIASQPSGHGATGDAEGVILLRTGRLDALEIDPGNGRARVGAGVKWGQVLTAAGAHGLTGLAGSSPVVSVAGYTLGGGLSWFSRRHGFAAASMRAFDVVDADVGRAHVTAESDPDLFWALRGGGGDFALVTALEFDLHPAPELYGGRMLWPTERAAQVLDAYRDLAEGAPEKLTAWFELLHFPGSPPMVAVDATYLGSAADARPLFRHLDRVDGLLADSRAMMQVADLGGITAEPTQPGSGISRGELLTDLTGALLAAPIAPLLSVQVRHLGGALARPTDTAAGHLAEPYSLYLFGAPLSVESSDAIRAKQDEICQVLAPYTTGRKPYTYLSPGEHAAAAFPAESLARLRTIKLQRDPHDVFRSNFPVLAA